MKAAQDQRIKVSRKFREDFDLVTKHYQFSPEEIEWLRNTTRSDYEMVKQSLEVIADEIRTLTEVAS